MNVSVIVCTDFCAKKYLVFVPCFLHFYIFAAKKKSEPKKSPTGVAGKDCNSLNGNIEQRKIVVSNYLIILSIKNNVVIHSDGIPWFWKTRKVKPTGNDELTKS